MMSGGDDGGGYETVATTTEEVISDEGISPAEEASIRINSINSMLERATKYPFSDDLTNEVRMLRELRFKVSDPEITSKINQTLEAFETKKQEMEEKADAAAGAAAAADKAAAQAQQARADSLQAAQAAQSSKDKKDMMWLIGGIGVLSLLFMGGKQLYQTIKNNKMQKQMMDSIKQAQDAAMRSAGKAVDAAIDGANPLAGVNAPGVNQMTQKVKNEAKRTLSKEAEAARQRLMQMKGTKGAAPSQPPTNSREGERIKPRSTSNTPEGERTKPKPPIGKPPIGEVGKGSRKPSMNDVIPSKYKRWRKPGKDNNDNNNKVSI
jgi:hypothetical protein